MTVIGYKGTPTERHETWTAMQIYRESSVRLRKSYPRIAEADSDRYRYTLKTYIQ